MLSRKLALVVITFGIWALYTLINFTLVLHVDSKIPSVQNRSFLKNFESFKSTRPWEEYMLELDTSFIYENILHNPNYCSKVELYRQAHIPLLGPDNNPLILERKVFSDYYPGTLVKEIIATYATLVFKDHYTDIEEYEAEEIPYYINMFFHKTPYFHLFYEIGSEFLCEGQMYNHIPGHEKMVYKDLAAATAKTYGEQFTDRKECFDPWKFIPYTFNMNNPEECKHFFTIFDPDSNTTDWILKISRNIHNGEGVTVLTKPMLYFLEDIFSNGEKCAKLSEYYIIQRYISNPLTIFNRKFDFRVYMHIASTDPLIILYHDGFLRISFDDYNATAEDGHITNTHLALEIIESINATEEEKEKMMEEQMWTFEKFESYMISEGKVEDGWLEKELRPKMKEKMYHLVKMHEENLLKHPGVFELYGLDYLLDDELNLWLLEVNRSPAMQATTEEKGKLQENLIKDILDIQYSILYKSDFDRAVNQSNFQVVFDDRKKGAEKYYSLFPSQCIN